MRFWHKTFLLTLVLFLLCLNAGIFSLAYYTYQKNVSAVEDACRAENDYIARSFERDYFDVIIAGKGTDPVLLMRSYGTHYLSQGIRLAFYEGDVCLYTSFEEGTALPAAGSMTQIKPDGVRHVAIGSVVNNRYRFVYAKAVGSLDEDYHSLMITFAFISLGVSLFFALCLYFVLKKLSVPLEKLRRTTETIAAGDLSITADESGSDEVSMLAKSFNAMVGKLKEHMDALELDAYRKQMLVDNMAHELRTPLTGIYGYAEYLEKAAVTEEERIDAAGCILSEAARLQRISEKILDTAYIRHNEIPKVKVDLAGLLKDTAGRLEGRSKKCGVSLIVAASNSIVEGDETLLSMLLYNLTENAIKACVGGGIVTLVCENRTMTVTDNGKGMTEEQLSHITEPFYRTDRSRARAEGGAGLGLALCKTIADAHGAEMVFSSEPGKGTTVKVIFIT